MLCDDVANPVTATDENQSEQRQATTPPTATAGEIQNNTAQCDENAAPRRNAFESVKAFLAHKYTRAILLTISGTCLLYGIGEIISDYLARSMKPNATTIFSARPNPDFYEKT
jgi:hypothetical protein